MTPTLRARCPAASPRARTAIRGWLVVKDVRGNTTDNIARGRSEVEQCGELGSLLLRAGARWWRFGPIVEATAFPGAHRLASVDIG